MMVGARLTAPVLGAPIDVVDWDTALYRIGEWARRRESRYVCLCNVHVVVTANRDVEFLKTIDSADMATPDGAPVAWMLRRLGFAGQERISGPDLMWLLCGRCEAEGVPVYFYGSTEPTLQALAKRLRTAFPELMIVGTESPPFRPLSAEEDRIATERINASGAGIVFVGLGCPKQERWMAKHRDRVNAVLIGVGAAFDFHAGTIKRAPSWVRNAGLEWLHRLWSDPRRLWRRYLVTNVLFVALAAKQLIFGKRLVR